MRKKLIGLIWKLIQDSTDGSSREWIDDIKARHASAIHKTPDEMKSHYINDVGLMLDEIDRLRGAPRG